MNEVLQSESDRSSAERRESRGTDSAARILHRRVT